jgi:hypothetical protein
MRGGYWTHNCSGRINPELRLPRGLISPVTGRGDNGRGRNHHRLGGRSRYCIGQSLARPRERSGLERLPDGGKPDHGHKGPAQLSWGRVATGRLIVRQPRATVTEHGIR